MDYKYLVRTAITAVFQQRDITAFDRYFSQDYVQHNPQLPNGTAALKSFIPSLPDDFGYEPGLITESGDFVMIHGRYKNWGGKNMIAVDIFRVADDKLVEHWDVMQEEIITEQSVNGNSMFPII